MFDVTSLLETMGASRLLLLNMLRIVKDQFTFDKVFSCLKNKKRGGSGKKSDNRRSGRKSLVRGISRGDTPPWERDTCSNE